jgi:hypothetical protein
MLSEERSGNWTICFFMIYTCNILAGGKVYSTIIQTLQRTSIKVAELLSKYNVMR